MLCFLHGGKRPSKPHKPHSGKSAAAIGWRCSPHIPRSNLDAHMLQALDTPPACPSPNELSAIKKRVELMDCWRISALAASLLIASVSPHWQISSPIPASRAARPAAPAGMERHGLAAMDSAHGKLGGRVRGNGNAVAEHTNDRRHHVRFLILGQQHKSYYSKSVYRIIRGRSGPRFGEHHTNHLYFRRLHGDRYGGEHDNYFAGTAPPEDGAWLLDDVSVTAVSVPEPTSGALLVTSLLGLAALRRRRSAD